MRVTAVSEINCWTKPQLFSSKQLGMSVVSQHFPTTAPASQELGMDKELDCRCSAGKLIPASRALGAGILLSMALRDHIT